MARYIDLDKAMERLNASPVFPNMGMDGYFLLGVVKNLLEKQPTADVVKVKHGYWKWEKKIEPQAQNRLYCSVCENECLGKNNYYVKSEYCPHCFARMDGTPKERGGEK